MAPRQAGLRGRCCLLLSGAERFTALINRTAWPFVPSGGQSRLGGPAWAPASGGEPCSPRPMRTPHNGSLAWGKPRLRGPSGMLGP